MNVNHVVVLVLLVLGLPIVGGAQTAQEVNEANNPLTPKLTINLHNFYTPSYYGLPDSDSNTGLLRGVLPHKLFGWPQILRASIPIVTSPDEPAGSTTGLGDINMFNLLLFKAGPLELGFGPQLTVDSATDDRLGTGKWQAGAAGIVIAPQPWGLLGGLVTYQHSFAGEGSRPTQNTLQSQPFVIYNLPQGFYLRSTATWNFDLQRGDYYIPLGFGVGKVWKLAGGTTLNVFVEPQWTAVRAGVAPEWQIFSGLNMQFPLGH
jgi:hypothetical protein